MSLDLWDWFKTNESKKNQIWEVYTELKHVYSLSTADTAVMIFLELSIW